MDYFDENVIFGQKSPINDLRGPLVDEVKNKKWLKGVRIVPI